MTDLDEALGLLHREARTSTAPLDDVRAKVLAAASTNVVPLRRRRLIPVAAAAAVLVAAGVVVVRATDAPSQAPPVATPTATTTSETAAPKLVLVSAADLLEDLAGRIRTVDQPLAPGQYRLITEHGTYSRSVVFGSSVDNPSPFKGGTYVIGLTSQTWIPDDVTKEWLNRRTRHGEPTWLGGNLPQADVPLHPSDTDIGERRGKCGDFFPNSLPRKKCGDPSDWDSPSFYAALPRDPAALLDWLRTSTAERGSTPRVMFARATEILRTGLMPADLRASWYRTLARIDGVKVTNQKVTIDGRTGVAITLEDAQERTELIIDPDTGDFIGERSVTGPGYEYDWLPEGTVLQAVSIRTTVVDGIG